MPSPLLPEVAERWRRRLKDVLDTEDGITLYPMDVVQDRLWVTAEDYLANHITVARAFQHCSDTYGSTLATWKLTHWDTLRRLHHTAWYDPTAALVELDRVLVGIENTEEQT